MDTAGTSLVIATVLLGSALAGGGASQWRGHPAWKGGLLGLLLGPVGVAAACLLRPPLPCAHCGKPSEPGAVACPLCLQLFRVGLRFAPSRYPARPTSTPSRHTSSLNVPVGENRRASVNTASSISAGPQLRWRPSAPNSRSTPNSTASAFATS